MILESQRGQELAKHLAWPIVARLAPDEIEDFDDLAEDFFDDPSLERDHALGSGLDLLPDLVVILMFVSATLDRLLAANGPDSPKSRLERLSKAVVRKQEVEQAPRFSPDEVVAAFESASPKIERLPESLQRKIKIMLYRLLLPVKILYLGASPEMEQRLGVDRELGQIEAILRESPLRDRIRLSSVLAVTADEIHRSLLFHHPQIFHFSGHGYETSVVIQEPNGLPRDVQGDSLLHLFDLFKDHLRLVVLNACHSEARAREAAALVDAAIGMAGFIRDSAALSFSRAFYRALAHGADLQRAFDLGCSQIELDGYPEEAGIPHLFALRDAPREIVLVETIEPEG